MTLEQGGTAFAGGDAWSMGTPRTRAAPVLSTVPPSCFAITWKP
jgi:hypothetical protein